MASMKPASWYAERYTSKYGFAVVPIEPGRKFPTSDDWGTNAIIDPVIASEFYTNHPDWSMGLVLSQSRMCSLDIDDEEAFAIIMEDFGIPAESLAKMPTIRGRGRRITFQVPEGMSLPYHKLNWPKQDDPKKQFTVFELRAATDGKQRQDLLPPGIHSGTGNPYTWEVKPPTNREAWPEPPLWLLTIWQNWDDFKPQLVESCPWVEAKPLPVRQPQLTAPTEGNDVIGAYNAAHAIEDTLRAYGYSQRGRRFLSPHSGTGLAGVNLFPDANKCWIHHASDPLCSDETNQPVAPFDLYCYYVHGGDVKEAVKAAANELGLKRERPPAPEAPKQPTAATPEDEPPEASKYPFRPLGYHDGTFYYLPDNAKQVISLTAAGHSNRSNLLSIAPLEWWESFFPAKDGVDWPSAINTCFRWCEQAGIFDEEKRRGRGAWHDSGHSVMHLGDRLIVDGTECAIESHRTRYIYEAKPPMEELKVVDPISKDDASKVVVLFNQLNWQSTVDAFLMAGFCALAPICGALSWRPHAWLTGQRGAGKSWVFNNMISPIVGGSAINVQGNSTEAGIRQVIGQDALPVLFDEAEGESVQARARMQSVLELARQASSDGSGKIAKGTSSGKAMSFRVRSMFLMGSINVGLIQASDKSRFSVLSLKANGKGREDRERFAKLQRDVNSILTADFCHGLRSRMYMMIPTIRRNAQTFATAAATHIGNQRAGDQIGALLAGGWALLSDDEVTPDEAMGWVMSQDWNTEGSDVEESDEHQLINEILHAQIKVDGLVNRSIAELIEDMQEGFTSNDMENRVSGALGRHGVRYKDGEMVISASHPELKKILKDTPWGGGWVQILERIPNARKVQGYRFAGVTHRAVIIPIDEVFR